MDITDDLSRQTAHAIHRAAEAGRGVVGAGHSLVEATAGHLPPVARPASGLRRDRLVALVLALALVAVVVELRRRQAERRREDRLRGVSLVSQAAADPVTAG